MCFHWLYWCPFIVSQLSCSQVLRNWLLTLELYPLVLWSIDLYLGTFILIKWVHPFFIDVLFNILLLLQWNEEVIVQVHSLPLIQGSLVWSVDLRLLQWMRLCQYAQFVGQVVKLPLQDLFLKVFDHFQSQLEVLEVELLKSLSRWHLMRWFYSIATIKATTCCQQLMRTSKRLDQFTVDSQLEE